MLCCFLSVIAMMGILGAFGWPVTVISSNFISLQLIITLAISVHLIVRFREYQLLLPEADHRTLLSQLEGTSAQLKTNAQGPLDSAAQDLIKALIDKLQAHEQAEEMLLQDALESDLGVGD